MSFVRVGTASQDTPVERSSNTSVLELLVGGALEHRGCYLARPDDVTLGDVYLEVGFQVLSDLSKAQASGRQEYFPSRAATQRAPVLPPPPSKKQSLVLQPCILTDVSAAQCRGRSCDTT